VTATTIYYRSGSGGGPKRPNLLEVLLSRIKNAIGRLRKVG